MPSCSQCRVSLSEKESLDVLRARENSRGVIQFLELAELAGGSDEASDCENLRPSVSLSQEQIGLVRGLCVRQLRLINVKHVDGLPSRWNI